MKKDFFFFVFVSVILFSGVLLTYIVTENRDFWHDEAFQYLFSNEKSIKEIVWEGLDVHPPLYNLLMKPVTFLTNNPFFLRLTSLFFSIITLIVGMSIVKGMYSSKYAFYIFAALLAVTNTFIYYSTEFRNYSFVIMLSFIYIWFLFKTEASPRPKYQIGMVVSLVLMAYTHFLSILIPIVSLSLILLLRRKIKGLRRIITAYLIFFLACLPLIPYLLKVLSRTHSLWYQDINLLSLISSYSYTFSLPNKYSLWLLLIPCLIITIFLFTNKPSWKESLLLGVWLIPPLIMFLASQIIPIYHHRYFIIGGFFVFIVLAGAIVRITQKVNTEPVFWIYIFLLWTYIILSVVATYEMLQEEQTYLKDSFKAVLSRCPEQGCVIYHTTTFSYTPYTFYSTKYNKINNLLYLFYEDKYLFTAGGSVVDDSDKLSPKLMEQGGVKMVVGGRKLPSFMVETKPNPGEIVYGRGGLYVTKTEY